MKYTALRFDDFGKRILHGLQDKLDLSGAALIRRAVYQTISNLDLRHPDGKLYVLTGNGSACTPVTVPFEHITISLQQQTITLTVKQLPREVKRVARTAFGLSTINKLARYAMFETDAIIQMTRTETPLVVGPDNQMCRINLAQPARWNTFVLPS